LLRLSVVIVNFFLSFRKRLDGDGPLPEEKEILEGFLGVIQPQIDPFMVVKQIQLPAVLIIGVDDVDERSSPVGQGKQQLFLDLLEFPRGDFEDLLGRIVSIREKTVVPAKLLGEKRVDEV
jgi:hypothetical protein